MHFTILSDKPCGHAKVDLSSLPREQVPRYFLSPLFLSLSLSVSLSIYIDIYYIGHTISLPPLSLLFLFFSLSPSLSLLLFLTACSGSHADTAADTPK
jgi:hypothetical protein